MKTLGFKKYCVQVEVQDDVMEFAVPARSKDEAKLYVEDAGRVIAVEDITDRKPISVDKVAAPLNAKRLNRKTPCALHADKCYDCNSPDRICRNLSVLWDKPTGSEYEIILIKEELGY